MSGYYWSFSVSLVSDYDYFSMAGDQDTEQQHADFDKSSTIPRNSDISQSYRRMFQTKRPASTAGLPSTQALYPGQGACPAGPYPPTPIHSGAYPPTPAGAYPPTSTGTECTDCNVSNVIFHSYLLRYLFYVCQIWCLTSFWNKSANLLSEE